MQRMDKQGPNADIFRYGLHPAYRVLQQGCAKFDALGSSIDCKPSQYHYRNRVQHIATNRASGLLM